MKSEELTAYPRSQMGRTGTKKVRTAGRIPATIYGREIKPLNLEVDKKALHHIIQHSISETKLVDLTISGEDTGVRLTLLQEVQHHPLSGAILHVDFHEVSESEKVSATVPIETSGEPVGVKTGGGVLEHVLFKVRVRALPRDLPEYLQLDVTDLEVDHTIHIGEMKLPDGVEVLADSHIPVVSVASARTATSDEAEGEEEGTAEVEMTKQKKDEKGKE
jgi:large subunit ribosomal protein L25